MNLDWIFGPRTTVNHMFPTTLQVRSTTIELETAIEIARLIETTAHQLGAPIVTTQWQVAVPAFPASVPRNINEAELTGLSNVERSRLILDINATARPEINVGTKQILLASVDLRENFRTGILLEIPEDSSRANELREQLARKIIDEGSPRFDSWRWRRIALYIPAALLALLWILVQLTSPLPIAAMLFGWVLVVLAIIGTAEYDRGGKDERQQFGKGVAGLRIRPVGREQLRLDRANSHRDIKIAVLTFVATAAASLLVAWLVYALNLNADHKSPQATSTPAAAFASRTLTS